MCALFGQSRDISLFRHLNRELLGNIINQQCAFYKFKLEETKVNMYGESSGGKFYDGPVLFNCLIKRKDQDAVETELGIDLNWGAEFSLLRDDLVDANVVPMVGDIILYNEGYFEIVNTNSNQFFVGKDPDYPNSINPLNVGLEEFGYNVSIICDTVYIPADRVNITKERYNG